MYCGLVKEYYDHKTESCDLYYSIQKQLERAMDGPIDVIHVKQVCGRQHYNAGLQQSSWGGG